MALAFVVEDGSGLNNATSLVSLSFADDYFEADAAFFAAWDALADADKQLRLIRASRVVEQKVFWRGSKAVDDSAFSWPRDCMVDRNCIAIENDVIPEPVKQLVCEMLKLLESSDITTGQDVDNLKRLKVDVIELEWQDKTSQPSLPSIFNDIIRGLGYLSNGGPRFPRILKT